MFRSLSELLGTPSTPKAHREPRAGSNRARLAVECLEAREVPTVGLSGSILGAQQSVVSQLPTPQQTWIDQNIHDPAIHFLARGFEADCCFYFENAARVRGKDRIDLKTDPPPDLVIEIEGGQRPACVADLIALHYR